MIAALAKFIDWSTIQVLSLLEPPPNAQGPRLEEALEFLKGPDFIPAESQPARVKFISSESGTFPLSHAASVRIRGEQCRLWPALPLRRSAGSNSRWWFCCTAGVMSSIIGTGFR